ncbi:MULTISPECIES: PH domain-containing protein [unclassified Corynebacterium]|uniref:PH domain-containing protein n=1 Tax=unclassified Corynebacterium TaxID=2624378 RepID=UPI0021A9B319|nr:MULTISPECIES: PH domain-containing protein [unclassified Corynebacterium]MCT1452004.1 PH domain-containing protein [Corynebacterium sp. p3-SID1145]MCT1461021.1 PH domain-containing protein [Corynebacterium sp. p3-SID1140]MDN8595009.1 PH domain-containing protein [Corynebacterium sp. P4_F2]WKK54797.1 PH domain-containing protein [Corynebacterium sp. P4-C1]WKK64174.1 PH domain-containing protein [Corynebacterium sp. P8-C1]
MTNPNASAYRRVHRLTPFLRAWAVAAALATLLVFNFTTTVLEGIERGTAESWSTTEIAQVAGVVVAVIAFALGLSQFWWSRIGFRLGENEVEMRSGLISTKVRATRYIRIQAVDVIEPFAPRLFGLAAVRVEAAGGSDSAIEIGYVPRAEADELRRELLHRIAAHNPAAEMPLDESTETTGTSEPALIPAIPVTRSLAGAALRLSTVFTVAMSLLPVLTEVTLAVVVPALVGFIPQIWQQIDQSWRYTATLDGEVMHLSYGLANRRSQAVPLDRVHAIRVSQPMLWRPFGWWAVAVNIAGYGRESNKQSGTSRLLPVGSYDQAVALVAAISPLTPEHVTTPEWDLRSPKRARIPSPLDASRQALSIRPAPDQSTWATTSHGLLNRRREFIDVSHIQEITYRQGPVQRMMDLAHVRFDLVPGPVKMKARDLDTADAWAVVAELSARELPPLTGPEGGRGRG